MPEALSPLPAPRNGDPFAAEYLRPSLRPERLEYSCAEFARELLKLPPNGLFETLRSRMPTDFAGADLAPRHFRTLTERPSFEEVLNYEARRQSDSWRVFDQIGSAFGDRIWSSAKLWQQNHELTRRVFTTETLLIPYDTSIFSDPAPNDSMVQSPNNWHLFGFHRNFGCRSCFGFLTQDAHSKTPESHWVISPVRSIESEIWGIMQATDRDSREARAIRALAPLVLNGAGEMSSISTHDGVHSAIFPVYSGTKPPSHYFTPSSAPLYTKANRENLSGWRMWGGDSAFTGFRTSLVDGQPSFDAYERFSLLLHRMVWDRRMNEDPELKPRLIKHGEDFLTNLSALGELVTAEYDGRTAARVCGHIAQVYFESFYLMIQMNDPALGVRTASGPSLNERLASIPMPDVEIKFSDLRDSLWLERHEVCSRFRVESRYPKDQSENSESYQIRTVQSFLADQQLHSELTESARILATPAIRAYGEADSFTATLFGGITLRGGDAMRYLTLHENDSMHLKIFNPALYREVCCYVSDYISRMDTDYRAWKRQP